MEGPQEGLEWLQTYGKSSYTVTFTATKEKDAVLLRLQQISAQVGKLLNNAVSHAFGRVERSATWSDGAEVKNQIIP